MAKKFVKKKLVKKKVMKKSSPKRTARSGPVTGVKTPCKCCCHGHFCDDDHECLSCGTTRSHKHKPYKGW